MAFRYTNEDTKRLKKAINNYNKKVSRLEKVNHPYLPSKVSLDDVKGNIVNKWDYNRQIKYLEQFTNRGSEKLIVTEGGATLTKYEYDLITQEQKRLYNKLSYKIKTYGGIKPRVAGVEQVETYARMGDEYYENLRARRSNISKRKLHNINKKELEILRNLLVNTQKQYDRDDDEFYNSFINKILPGADYYWRLESEKIEYIREKLKTLTPNGLFTMYQTEQTFREVMRIYHDKTNIPYSEGKREMQNLIDIIYENIDTMVQDYV